MAKTDSVRIAITCADDTVALMTFVTREYRKDGSVAWERVADAPTVNLEVARAAAAFDPAKRPLKGWHPVSPDDIPVDRTFRNALRHDPAKGFSHCPIHSKEIALEKVRASRAAKFLELDAQRARAVRKGNRALIEEIDARAEALADLTEPIKACSTVEELKKTLQTLGVE